MNSKFSAYRSMENLDISLSGMLYYLKLNFLLVLWITYSRLRATVEGACFIKLDVTNRD